MALCYRSLIYYNLLNAFNVLLKLNCSQLFNSQLFSFPYKLIKIFNMPYRLNKLKDEYF